MERMGLTGCRESVQSIKGHLWGLLSEEMDSFLFMKYAPGDDGSFVGQTGYGYRSIEDFVDAACTIGQAKAGPADFRGSLATVQETDLVTAILEAGRRSLDAGGQRFTIDYDAERRLTGISPR